mgnify:CR=1 FL=1
MKKNKKKKKSRTKWILTVMITSFILSLIFSSLSESVIPNINIVFGILIIIIFIGIGIIFDMIGVAITAANETPFHSMASKKVKGSKHSVMLLKNSDKLASICNDVIGDVCGVVSGSAGMLVASNMASKSSLERILVLILVSSFNINSSITVLFVTALIASITIGGKAIGKSAAIKNSEAITFKVGKILNLFNKKTHKKKK